MTYLLIRHKVADFEKWKTVYDRYETVRRAAGLTSKQTWHNLDIPSEIFILFEVADREKAKSYISSLELHKAMQEAGVLDHPDVYFLG